MAALCGGTLALQWRHISVMVPIWPTTRLFVQLFAGQHKGNDKNLWLEVWQLVGGIIDTNTAYLSPFQTSVINTLKSDKKMYVKILRYGTSAKPLPQPIESVKTMYMEKESSVVLGKIRPYLRRGNQTNRKQRMITLRYIKLYANFY